VNASAGRHAGFVSTSSVQVAWIDSGGHTLNDKRNTSSPRRARRDQSACLQAVREPGEQQSDGIRDAVRRDGKELRSEITVSKTLDDGGSKVSERGDASADGKVGQVVHIHAEVGECCFGVFPAEFVGAESMLAVVFISAGDGTYPALRWAPSRRADSSFSSGVSQPAFSG
jgi:hypothetical protein